MAEIKSIVGQHYNAKGLYAIDLKTTQETELGDKWHYEIIRDPYLSERPIISFITGLKELFIEVIDTRTGRDYKVLYKPANLIYKQEKQNDSKEEGPMDNMAFIKKTAQICEEMSDVINNSNDIKQKCAFILLAITDDDKCEKPSLATCYGGTRDRLANLIELLCSNDSRCMDFVTKGTQNACIRNSYKRHQ